MDNTVVSARAPKLRHRGRFLQINICLGKLIRGFVYQSDWKVLPMTAIIAALFSMVVRNNFFQTMEGTLLGSFGLVCVCIWNGCFNSVQVICRERKVLKREHRSGLHMSSYIAAHMIYQALLCAAQTLITLYICLATGTKIPTQGFLADKLIWDLFVSLFLIAYAADMLSLLISAVARSTTAAMTVMPFLLIFQLVFSGGFFSLPDWADKLTSFSVSNYGLRAVAAQADYNGLPMASGWNTLDSMLDSTIEFEFTTGQAIDAVNSSKNASVAELRNQELLPGLTVGSILENLGDTPGNEELRSHVIHPKFKLRDVVDFFGRDRVRDEVRARTGAAAFNARYDRSVDNVAECWIALALWALFYAFAAMVVLEFIDRDKR